MNKDFRKDTDDLLSGLKWGREDARAVYAALEGEKPVMKRKLSMAIALALAIVLLCAVALAIGFNKSEKLTTLDNAKAALADKYGLTTEMLRLYNAQLTDEDGNAKYTFTTMTAEFMDEDKAGEYYVVIDKGGKAQASWSHDGADPASYESGELTAEVWGVKQLQGALDRYHYYLKWCEETPMLGALPIAEQIRRVIKLRDAIAPLELVSYDMPLGPTDDDLSEDKAIELAKAYVLDNFSEAVDEGWDIFRSFTPSGSDDMPSNNGGSYDIYFAPKGRGTKYWMRVLSPSGAVTPQSEHAETAGGEPSITAAVTEAQAIAAAEAELGSRYGLTRDMLGLFIKSASLAEKDGTKLWTVVFGEEEAWASGKVPDMADWRWWQALEEKQGVYAVALNADSGEVSSVEWSLEGAEDLSRYTEGDWAQAKAYDARILGFVLKHLEKTKPIADKYGDDQTEWFTVEDAAAYDQAFRDAGFDANRYMHAIPKESDISADEAKRIAVQMMLDAYGLKADYFDGAQILTEYSLKDGGTWYVGFYTATGMGNVQLRASDGEAQEIYLDSGATSNG